jgi:uncharacterized protein (TIGR02391 family)
LCNIFAHTYNGFTKNEIVGVLKDSNIPVIGDINKNKRQWLYDSFYNEINRHCNNQCVFDFIESAFRPERTSDPEKRVFYEELLKETNGVLISVGLSIDKNGKIVDVDSEDTLIEADKRAESLRKKLAQRAVHPEVMKCCASNYLRKDYYDIVFEAARGLSERVRKNSGIASLDGIKLFQEAFSERSPNYAFKLPETDDERKELLGLEDLCCAVFYLFRNFAARSPRVDWKSDESKALDALSLISFAHQHLDEFLLIKK